LLFGVYVSAGLLSGSIGGAFLALAGRDSHRSSHPIVVNLILTAAFAANLIRGWPLARSEQVALATAAALAAVLTAGLISEAWLYRAEYFASPWIVTLLLLAGPWMSQEAMRGRAGTVRALASCLAVIAVIAVAIAWRKMGPVYQRMAAGIVLAGLVSGIVWSSRWAGAVRADKLPNPAPATGKPNIILITMDTVRADHLSVYGYDRDTTPHLREFAREATLYERAIAASDFTLPSHASIFTGMYPSWHDANWQYPFGRPLAPVAVTLAEVLAANGYTTAGIYANGVLSGKLTGLDQGFAIWSSGAPARLAVVHPFYFRNIARKVLDHVVDTGGFDAWSLRASDINRHACAILEKIRKSGPFFLFLNYMDAHFPYVSPHPFSLQFSRGTPHSDILSHYGKVVEQMNGGRRHIQAAERSSLTSRYDGGIAYLDSEIGKLMTWLRQSGLYDNTLIIITGDHGEAFGEHERLGHASNSVYQDQVHVPLLVKYPHQCDPAHSTTLVSHVDIMPTVLNFAGCARPAGLQGEGLRLRRDSEVVFAEARSPKGNEATPRLRGVHRAIFAGGLKLIAWSAGHPEVYDLATDPEELTNRFQPDDPRATALLSRLNAWFETAPKRLPKSGTAADDFTLEQLKSLGYLQ
jgi:arylsulfatase A-like enzyme